MNTSQLKKKKEKDFSRQRNSISEGSVLRTCAGHAFQRSETEAEGGQVGELIPERETEAQHK